ncbi:BRCA1 protein [Cooperia oncophora]
MNALEPVELGSRFSQPTASPHYAADMRSPPLMSPTQAPMAPQAAMPRPMSNGDMVTQPIRMVPTPQQPVIPSQFFTYEPNLLMNGTKRSQTFGDNAVLISFSGFDESERAAMKFMVEAMGARFTPYLSRHNNILIAKTAGVEKVEKAREWDIQVVNYQWLADNYAGQRVDADNQRYPGVSPGPYALEMINDQFKQLLLCWKMPVIVTPEQWRRSFDTKQAVENDEGVFPNKKLRMQSAPPSEAEIAAKAQEHQKSGVTHPAYVVAFSGIDDENKHVLTQKLRYLGGRACEEVSECTHLVTTNGRRTERLLEAICLGKNIVNPYWIVHGYECRQWMDTLDYFLHDEDQERHLGYNCKRSVVRARHKKVFEDVQFYITPSVEPSRAVLTKLIRLAGGTVHENRPAPAHIAVYNTDMVLIALMRQELEPHPLYRVSTASLVRPTPPPSSQPQTTPTHQHFRPIPSQSQPHRVKA